MSSYFHQFLLRRDTLSELDSANPILASGEPTIALDKNILKIGDGEHRWEDLPSFISSRELKHKSIAVSIPAIQVNDSYILYVSFSGINSNNKYAVVASPSTDLPEGVIISHCYVSGNNTVAIKFTNVSLSNLNAGNVNQPASNSSSAYSGTINIIAYMTDEAIIPPVITTTPPPVRDSFYSFGYNNFGQLGLDDLKDRTRPTYAGLPVSGNPENLWNDISLGYYHTLAISKSGDLFSFGYNYYGQLGNGEFGIGKNIKIPTLIDSGINWTKVSAGAYHSLAIGDGKLFTFGSNAHGSLGLGDTNLRKDITGLNAQYIYETLSPQSSGKILNNKLILNYNTNSTYIENKLYTLPVGSSVAISLDAGYYLAVLNRNRTNLIAYSGVPNEPLTTSIIKNVSGTKYDGEYTFYNGKVSISALGNYDKATLYFYNIATDSFSYYGDEDILRSQDDTGWTQISAGHYHSLGIKNGYLYSWGNNAFGQLGIGDNVDRYTPELVSQDSTWVAVAAGNYHSLAIKNNAGTYQLYTFGKNDHGQLGLNSSLAQIKIPTLVNSSFNEISLYNTETLQAGSNISIENLKYIFNYSNGKTYDVDDKYVLSEGTYVISGVPSSHPIAFLNVGKTDLFTYVGQNNAGTKVVDGNQYTFYHGNVTVNVYGNFDSMSAYSLYHGYMGSEDLFLYDNANANPVNVDAGIDFSIVRTNLDEVWTFGKNNLGQLGLGDYSRRIKPHKVKEYNWTQIAAGANHALLLDSSKKMWSFGDNAQGQLGLGDNFGRNEPTVVNALERYDEIVAGGNHSIGAIFSAAPTVPIITNVLTSNDTNDIYDRNLKILWEDVLSEQYGVTDYIIESGASINGPWELYSDSTSDDKFVTISGATVGTNYFFRVKSKNEEGFSDYSNVASGIPERLIDDLYCSTMLLLHFDNNFNSASRFTSTYNGINSPALYTNDSMFGKSYYDNGSTKQLQYFNNQDFNIPNDLCVEFYFKGSGINLENVVRSILQGNNFITSSVNNEGNSFAVLSSGQNIIIAEKQNSTIRTLFTYPIPQNRQTDWNHFAWVRDDLTHKLFFNGVQVSGYNQTSVLSYSQNTIKIGGNNTNSNNGIYTSFGMKGFIDELRITKQPRYTQSFSNDLFKRPFGEVAAENCGSSFGGIPLTFDSAYSWNYDIGSQTTRVGQEIFSASNWGGPYVVTTNVVSGDTIGLSSYYNPYITTRYVEAYLDSSTPNSIVGYSGITTSGIGTQVSPIIVSGEYSNVDKIFSINRSGILTLTVNVNNNSEDYDQTLYLIKNGIPNYVNSGIVVGFDKYEISGVGSTIDPMHVKIGRNFFFNKPRETSKVWVKVNVDGYLDIDTAKYNNQEGWWLYKTTEEPSQHFEYSNTSFGSSSYINTDDVALNKYFNYLPIVDAVIGTLSNNKTYAASFSSTNNPHNGGGNQQIYQRYENIPIKKGEYIVCGFQASGNLPSPPNTCPNSGEVVLRVREANNLLELDFENNLIDKSSFDHKVVKNYELPYSLIFEKDSAVGEYSIKFPQGTSSNPISSTNDYRFPLSIDLPTNYLGVQDKFTIETFFKFDSLQSNVIEYHRLFAIERPLLDSSNPTYIDNQKRDYINFTIQTSGNNVIGAQLAFNAESIDESYSDNAVFLYGFKDVEEDNIIYTLNIPQNKLTNISVNNWNHVALVRYYDMMLLFVNGQPISNSVIGKKRWKENYNDIYLFNNLTTWGGNYTTYNIPVSSGDILGLKTVHPTTNTIFAYYSAGTVGNEANAIQGMNNIVVNGTGADGDSFAVVNGNYANNPNILLCNYTGSINLTVLVDNGGSASPQDLIILKNGTQRRAISIDDKDLELPPRFDIRNYYTPIIFPSVYRFDGQFRKIGAPLTVGPIRGNLDLFKISSESKYLTSFDSSLLVYKNDEYFSYDGRKYKKKDTFIYNFDISAQVQGDQTSLGNHELQEIESSGKYTSLLLECNPSVSKVNFSVASYKPQTKIRLRRTNKEKEIKFPLSLTQPWGTFYTRINLLNDTQTSLSPCMSTSNDGNFYVEQEGDHPIINLDLLNYNSGLPIFTSGLYYQDFELTNLPPLSYPHNYIYLEIIHDEDDILFTRPSVPLNLIATSGYNSITLNWNSPENYGGENLSNYIVDSSMSGSLLHSYERIPKTNSYTISNLTANSGYLLSLAAMNIIGSGDFTDPVLAYPLAPRVPFAPQNVNIYSTSGSMLVNWEKPTSDGGEAITSYRILYTPSGGSQQTFSTQSTRAILNPLSNNVRHSIYVTAINSIGSGDISNTLTDTVRPKTISTCGSNGGGNLGTGNTNNLNIPSGIQGFNNNWIEISMGIDTACAINSSGELYAWGSNGAGQIGDGTYTSRYIPTKALGPVNNVNLKWKKCSVCTSTVYVISEDGYLYGVGAGSFGELGIGAIDPENGYNTVRLIQCGHGETFGKNNWKDVKAGPANAILLDNDGNIYLTGAVTEAPYYGPQYYEPTKINIFDDISQNGSLKFKAIFNTSRNYEPNQFELPSYLSDLGSFYLCIDIYDRLIAFIITHSSFGYPGNAILSNVVEGISNCVAAAGFNDRFGRVISAINSSGELYVCGNNGSLGLIGSGITSTAGRIFTPSLDPEYASSPIAIRTSGTPSNFINVVPVYRGFMALNSSGEIWSIGRNSNGVFGIGNNNINSANTTFVKSSGTMFYDKISSNSTTRQTTITSSMMTLGY